MEFWGYGKEQGLSILHCLSVSEKDQVMEDLWKQHTEEMLVLEGSILNVCDPQCTLEFQPSADQSWQSWANGELNQAASYPSPYAFVHKGNLGKMGGSIGHSDSSTWKPPIMEKRGEDLKKLQTFRASLNSSLSHEKRHNRELAFTAENGIRQIVYPSRVVSRFLSSRIHPKSRQLKFVRKTFRSAARHDAHCPLFRESMGGGEGSPTPTRKIFEK